MRLPNAFGSTGAKSAVAAVASFLLLKLGAAMTNTKSNNVATVGLSLLAAVVAHRLLSPGIGTSPKPQKDLVVEAKEGANEAKAAAVTVTDAPSAWRRMGADLATAVNSGAFAQLREAAQRHKQLEEEKDRASLDAVVASEGSGGAASDGYIGEEAGWTSGEEGDTGSEAGVPVAPEATSPRAARTPSELLAVVHLMASRARSTPPSGGRDAADADDEERRSHSATPALG